MMRPSSSEKSRREGAPAVIKQMQKLVMKAEKFAEKLQKYGSFTKRLEAESLLYVPSLHGSI